MTARGSAQGPKPRGSAATYTARLWVGEGPRARRKLPGASAVHPGLRTCDSFPFVGEGINKEALVAPSHHTAYPQTRSHARPCTHARTLRYTHTPTHAGTDTHTHCFLLAAGTRVHAGASGGAGPATPTVAGRAAPVRVTARLLRAPGAPQSPRRAAPRSLRLFVMLIPFPSWCQLPAQ